MADRNSATTIGGMMVAGMGGGVAIGAALDNIPICMAAGTALGIIVGTLIDVDSREENDQSTGGD